MAQFAYLRANYIDESFIQEANAFGGIHFSDVLQKIGFSQTDLDKSLEHFTQQKRPDNGAFLLRQQKNSSTRFDCAIFAPRPSVRAFLAALPESESAKKEAVLKAAYTEAAEFIAKNEHVRLGPGGIRREPAQGLYFIAMHGTTRSRTPQSYPHAHVVYMNAGITGDGQSFSVAGENRIRHLKEADLLFQLKLAEGLEKEFGVKCEFKSRVCEIPGVSQKAIERCTGAKAAEISKQISDSGVENTPRNRRLANDILRQNTPKFSEYDSQKLKANWRHEALQAQPNILTDARYKKGQSPTAMQDLARLEMPRVEAIRAKASFDNSQSQSAQNTQQNTKTTGDGQAASSSLLKRTQQDQEKKAATQRRVHQTSTKKLREAAKNLFANQARPAKDKKAEKQQEKQQETHQEKKEKAQQNDSRKRNRRDFDSSERVRQFNEEKQRQKKDFLKAEKSWLGEQLRESLKTLKAIVQARFRGERKVVKVHNLDAFIEKTRKRSIAEGHRAARKAVRSTRVHSFKHALEVAQEGYKQGRKPRLILPKKTHIVLAKNQKLTVEQAQELEKLKKKYHLRFHQDRKRDIDLKSITVVNEAQQQRGYSQ